MLEASVRNRRTVQTALQSQRPSAARVDGLLRLASTLFAAVVSRHSPHLTMHERWRMQVQFRGSPASACVEKSSRTGWRRQRSEMYKTKDENVHMRTTSVHVDIRAAKKYNSQIYSADKRDTLLERTLDREEGKRPGSKHFFRRRSARFREREFCLRTSFVRAALIKKRVGKPRRAGGRGSVGR